MPFRSDHKTRFSDPPAPPPQQPLPEKPDVPSLKRSPTERPKSGPPNPSPVRQENLNQIIHLTEALNNAKRDMDSQTARMRELESMLQKEREARELAEDLARRLEESANAQMNGIGKAEAPEPADDVSEPTREKEMPEIAETQTPDTANIEPEMAQETAAALQSRIDSMDGQMRDLRDQLESWKQRCETAESERDEGRESLAEMVVQLRAEEAQRVAAQDKRRSRSRKSRSGRRDEPPDEGTSHGIQTSKQMPSNEQSIGVAPRGDPEDDPTLSRANTITPLTGQRGASGHDLHLQAGLPYASMLGVVLIGMGLMAYINGWQSPPPRLER